MVELFRRYSKPLVSVLERINEELPASEKESRLISADGPSPQAWRVNDRLASADIKSLLTSYLSGSTIRVLAEQYGISTTSVKRLLRQHGARKQRPRSAA
jgi:DNA invertase Pin-like site-specific DNA recombinase